MAKLKSTAEVTRELNPLKYAGNYVVDAKFIPAKAYIVAKPSIVPRSKKRQKIKRGIVHISGCDYATHDLPLSLTSQAEDYWAYEFYFKQLFELGYPLKSLICDDKPSIRSACFQYYPEAQIQLCLRHYSEEIARKLKIRLIERIIQSLEKKLDRMGDDFFYDTRPVTQQRAIRLVNRIADLEHKYWVAQEFSQIINLLLGSKTDEAYQKHAGELKEFFQIMFPLEHGSLRKRIIKTYKKFQEDKCYLFTSFDHPELDIPERIKNAPELGTLPSSSYTLYIKTNQMSRVCFGLALDHHFPYVFRITKNLRLS